MSHHETTEFPDGVTSVRTVEQKVFDGEPFPLILSPDSEHLGRDASYWQSWTVEHLVSLKSLLLKYGAILFRQFPFDVPDFDKFAKSFGWEEFPYVGGVSVREPVVGNVYTSTESPPECIISFHHEMAHVVDHPKVDNM